MFGLGKEKPHAKVSYEKLKCKCGNDNFRHVTKITFIIYDHDGSIRKRAEPGEFCFECTKCGILYDRFGEVAESVK